MDEVRRQHEATRVTEVHIEVGPLSGVEPLLLHSAFDLLVLDSAMQDAQLVIDEVPLRARCEACDFEFEIVDFDFRCPTCRGNVKTISGDEFQLVSVSLSESCEAVS